MAFRFLGNQEQDQQQSFNTEDSGVDMDGKPSLTSFMDQSPNCGTGLKPRSSTTVQFTDDVTIDNSSPLSLSPSKISFIKNELEAIFLEMEKNVSPIVRAAGGGEALFENGVKTQTEANLSAYQTLWLSPDETTDGPRREPRLVHIGRPGRTPATRLVRPSDSLDAIATLDIENNNKVENDLPKLKESSLYEWRK